MHILERIEAGEISAQEGIQQIETLAASTGKQPGLPDTATDSVSESGMRRWLWHAVLWPGVACTVGGSLLIAGVYAWGLAPGWQIVGVLLLVLGVLGTVVASWMQRAHWLSLRIREREGKGITLAIPLPLNLAAWALRVASPIVPHLRETGVDELILSMSEELQKGQPLVVEVNDEGEGEQVLVRLG
jgi:hypothetical protein